MIGELQPTTEPGKRFVALAEEHAADFATRADQHDREGSFAFENFEAMQKSGFMAAPVPEEFGGLGLRCISDMAIGMSRLARGDGSTAIAANMHLSTAWTIERLRCADIANEATMIVPLYEGLLKSIADQKLVAGVFSTEAGTTIAYPNTEATKTADGGYLLNGHKIFGTLSPLATLWFSSVRVAGDDGEMKSALAMIGRGTEGVDIKDNWDAMGMRASGSGDVVYKDVQLSRAQLVGGTEPLGEQSANSFEMVIAGNCGLIASFMGIAEAAADIALEMAKKRRKGPSNTTLAERAWVRHLAGEMMMELETCRGMLSHAAQTADAYIAAYPRRGAPMDVALERQRQFQSAKYVVNRKAIDVVDKALTLSGGAGYMTKHPLSRLYRDVRAGPFMQPFAPGEALEFIGRVALEQDPRVDG